MLKNKLRLLLIAGARPNFMKIAPIVRELSLHNDSFDWAIVHTGQHYDREMSDVFFEELGIPKPDYYLEVGSGTHAEQTAKIMVKFETVCREYHPDIVVVVGDVNSTLACAIVSKKLGVRVAHVEAGLRSGDMSMPEEINRIVTDAISDLFFVTEPSGLDNLKHEGHRSESIYFVGHVMIDNLMYQLKKLLESSLRSDTSSEIKQKLNGKYGVVTLHRPSNVDDPVVLSRIVKALSLVAEHIPLVFPVHPRTAINLEKLGRPLSPAILMTKPLPYMEFLNLWKDATLILTDSGGLQEESTALGIPCLTLRDNTERPITLSEGSNRLVGNDGNAIVSSALEIVDRSEYRPHTRRPPLWDGEAARRIVTILRAQQTLA